MNKLYITLEQGNKHGFNSNAISVYISRRKVSAEPLAKIKTYKSPEQFAEEFQENHPEFKPHGGSPIRISNDLVQLLFPKRLEPFLRPKLEDLGK